MKPATEKVRALVSIVLLCMVAVYIWTTQPLLVDIHAGDTLCTLAAPVTIQNAIYNGFYEWWHDPISRSVGCAIGVGAQQAGKWSIATALALLGLLSTLVFGRLAGSRLLGAEHALGLCISILLLVGLDSAVVDALLWGSATLLLARLFLADTISNMRVWCSALLTPVVIVLSLVPKPPTFDYPSTAHLVPDDGIPGYIFPSMASSAHIPYVDQGAVDRFYFEPTMLLLLLLVVMFFKARISVRAFPSFFLCASVCTVTVLFDIIPSASVAMISPLATLSRVVPGGWYLSFVPLALGFGLYFFFAALAERRFPLVLILILLLLGLREHRTEKPAARRMLAMLYQQPHVDPKILEKVASPSMALLAEQGLHLLTRTGALEPLDIARGDVVISVSSGDPTVLNDRKKETRWNVPQTGEQWVSIETTQPMEIDGIKLATGDFPTDFPRGIAVASCAGCSDEPDGYCREIVHIEDWQGPVLFTPLGFPYFGAQQTVVVRFPEPLVTSCVRVSQIAQRAGYDWSITRIELLRLTGSD